MPTIHERREKELEKLIAFNPEAGEGKARRLMNSFYRLCGLSEWNLYAQNDSDRCNTAYAKRQEEREIQWYERLDKDFNDTYGLRLVYCGYMPSIGTLNKGNGFSEKIERIFYR